MRSFHFKVFVFSSLIIVFLFSLSFGQTKIQVLSENEKELIVRFEQDQALFNTVQTPWGEMSIPTIDQGTYVLKQGYPEMQKLTASVIIPAEGNTLVEVIASDYYEVYDIDICPSKGNLLRNIHPDDIPYTKGTVYTKNEFWPSAQATVREPYILRDYRGQTIVVTPFSYNPVIRTLRVYTSITVKLKFEGGQEVNQLKSTNITSLDNDYENIYEKHFLNFSDHSKYTPLGEDGKMLIISHGAFIPQMEPFVRWKNQKGIPTQIVDVATIGNSAQIKSYVANYYSTNGLTYLLLVGDHAQIPASSTTAGPSDNNYAYIVGADHYPDIFVGRFSAETAAHVSTQVDRSVQYEKYPQISATWYKKGVGIASEEGPGHNNLYDHQHIQLLRSKLLTYTYSDVSEHYEGSQGGVDLPGNPTATQVHNDINPGAGVIVYTGHGWEQGWGTSGYSNTQVNQLTNFGKLPFIWSVACVNGDFLNTTCFAESWLRATQNEQPTGAIATMMSTINQSWNPPMSGQLEMVDILVESYSSNKKRSFGGISMNGCMKMNDDYGTGGNDMTDTWALFGDPSIVVRTDFPGAMTVTHPAQAIIGSSTMDIQCNINDALVCLSIDGVILGRGYVSSGNVQITFSPLTTPDPIDVVVTAYNKQTYLGQINVIPPVGPYVIKEVVAINDVAGNNNGLADFGENIQLNVTLKNIGVDPASNVSATLTTANSFVNITAGNSVFGNIGAGASNTVNNAFSFSIQNNIPDQESVLFHLSATNGVDVWVSTFSIVLQAPVLSVPTVLVNDPGGNQNGRLDPGETVNIIFNTANSGHSSTPIATGTLSSTSPYITISSSTVNAGVIIPGNQTPVSFQVIVDPSTPIGTPVEFSYICNAAPYSASRQITMSAGLIVEDWETNDFTSYTWTSSGNAPWQIISGSNAYEGSFAAKSGIITDDQMSVLSITMNVLSDDTISFYKKVSCEYGSQYSQWWDYLVFHINSTEIGKWDGEVNWSREAFFVTAGSNTFKWSYIKDYIYSEGEDAAWIDFVVFPPVQTSASVDERPSISHYITCFPNPANDVMTVNIGLAQDDVIYLQIIDVQGKIVRNIETNTGFTQGNYSKQIFVGDLLQGNYFLRMTSESTFLTHPFVIVR